MSYMGAHNRVRRIRGRAADQQCGCGSPAREWAYVPSPNEEVDAQGRRYSRDVSDYVAMCKPCHQRFDKAAITQCPRGHEYVGDNLLMEAGKRKCRTCVYERNRSRPLSAETKAKKAEYQRRQRALKRAAA